MDKIIMELEGADGNAFAILGRFSREAKRQGWEQDRIDAVIKEATKGDYDHLLRTIMANVEEPDA